MTNSKQKSARQLVNVVSFGFKKGTPPLANVLFDVRFLKNPYWVEELRPLSGRDLPVRDYVMEQTSAQQFIEHLFALVGQMMPAMFDTKGDEFTIALGCTGGQHRSVAVAEDLASRLKDTYPDYQIVLSHRELDHHDASADGELQTSAALKEGN